MKSTFVGNFFALVLIIFMITSGMFLGSALSVFGFSDFTMNIIRSLYVYVLPICLYFYATKQTVKDTLMLKKPNLMNLVLVVAISFAIQPLLMLISAVSTLVFPNNVTKAFEVYSTTPLWQLLIMSAVLPAIMEEISFRGIIFSNYRNIGFKKAAAATGFIFAMAHMDGQQFLYAFFMGMVFSYFLYKTGSIYVSMLSHFIINGTQTTMAHFLYTSSGFSAAGAEITIESLVATALPVVYTAPFLILLFMVFHRRNTFKIEIGDESISDFSCKGTTEKIFNAPLIIFIILFIISLFGAL